MYLLQMISLYNALQFAPALKLVLCISKEAARLNDYRREGLPWGLVRESETYSDQIWIGNLLTTPFRVNFPGLRRV